MRDGLFNATVVVAGVVGLSLVTGIPTKAWWAQLVQPDSLAAWAQVVVTVVAGYIAYRAFTNERETVRLTQRADVLMTGVTVSTHPRPLNSRSELILWFKNCGATRANGLQFQGWLKYADVQDTPRTNEIPAIVLAHNEQQSLTFEPLGKAMNEATYRAIMAGTMPLTFSAEATYVDVFGQFHRSWSEGRFVPATNSFVITKYEAN